MDNNKEAFRIAFQATTAPTFHEARALLSDIKVERISDPELEEHVHFCKDLCDFCIKYGVRREAGVNMKDVVRTMSVLQAAGAVLKDSLSRWRLFAGPGMFMAEGLRLSWKLRGWAKLHDRLAARYRD